MFWPRVRSATVAVAGASTEPNGDASLASSDTSGAAGAATAASSAEVTTVAVPPPVGVAVIVRVHSSGAPAAVAAVGAVNEIVKAGTVAPLATDEPVQVHDGRPPAFVQVQPVPVAVHAVEPGGMMPVARDVRAGSRRAFPGRGCGPWSSPTWAVQR